MTCYNCNKRGHYKPDCPLIENHPTKIKKSALLGIWEDNDISSLEEEEKNVYLCLMAMEDDVSYENSFNFTFDELFEAFNELIYEFNQNHVDYIVNHQNIK